MRAFFQARWRSPRLKVDIDDCIQEVLLRCIAENSPLDRASSEHPGGFRVYLVGICRMVALEHEAARRRDHGRVPTTPPLLDEMPGREESLTHIFNRSFAQQVMEDARRIHQAQAKLKGAEA